MSEFSAAVDGVFGEIWDAYGRPYLRVYRPISTWTLGAGVTYNPTRDRFEDAEGDAVTISYTTAAGYADVRYVPLTRPSPFAEIAVAMATGAVEQPSVRAYVEYSAATLATLGDYWAIRMGATLYRLTDRAEWRYMPVGAVTPELIVIGLIEQVKRYA
jgi:hypothetical protein